MAHLAFTDVSVSYYLRHRPGSRSPKDRGSVGAELVAGRHYLEIPALQGVSFSFGDGSRVGLIGVNGSGKSTLLKTCSGALSIKSGTMRSEGRISPQFSLGAGIKPALTGRRNAELKCLYANVPWPAIPEAIEQVKEVSGLGGYFELPVQTYSAGMRSRFVMGLMQLQHGDILIMDEWISAADASVGDTASQLRQGLMDRGSIILLASHSRELLTKWTETLVWLDAGRVRNIGPTAEVLADYDGWIASIRKPAPEKAS